MFLKKDEIINKINQFSGARTSFLFVIDFSGEKGIVLTAEEANDKGIKYDIDGFKNDTETIAKMPGHFSYSPVSFKTYKKAFEKVVFHLKRGDTYLLNLTFPTPLNTDLSLEELFAISRARYKLCIPGHFVVFSPELFVRLRGSGIHTCPMKGTIDADIPDAAEHLLADTKELFEHNTIVDLLRNDLSMVSTCVKVRRSRFIDRIHTNRGDLLQMSSEICGNLPHAWMKNPGEIIFKLLPAGSVTGAPKKKTVEIIHETETYDREFYTGIFGFFNGNSLTSAVSIRFIENRDGKLVFKSGGGITALSKAKSEYEEMLKKVYVPIV